MTSELTICLNADIGEIPGPNGRALDRALLDIVTRCSVACGGHAGDTESMEATLKAAAARHVLVGAHPSYPDVEGFGRKSLKMPIDELKSSIVSQCRTLKAIAREKNVSITHLKPHGALYADAARDMQFAEMIVKIAIQLDIPLLIGPPRSLMQKAAKAHDLPFLLEAFADRTYESNGTLTPRSESGSLIEDDNEAVAQTLQIVTRKQVTARNGDVLDMDVGTLCLHGDSPGSVSTAFAVRQGLLAHRVKIEAVIR